MMRVTNTDSSGVAPGRRDPRRPEPSRHLRFSAGRLRREIAPGRFEHIPDFFVTCSRSLRTFYCAGNGDWSVRTYSSNHGGVAMSHAKQTSKRKRPRKALPVLGAAGLSLSLAGGASGGPAVDMPTRNGGVNHEITLVEEEISDVTLATFYVFDKENIGTPRPGVQLARGGCGGGGCGCRGCGGCGGFRGCGGCRGCVGFRGCGGCVGFVACGGCGGCSPWWGGCCISWGGCRLC